MEISKYVTQVPLENLNYSQLKELTRKEISNFLVSKKERILLLARKLEENEKIKNKICAHLCRDFGDLISPDYIRECVPDIYKEKSKARDHYNRLAGFSPAKITKYDNMLIEKDVEKREAMCHADLYHDLYKGLMPELTELEDQLIELKQQQVQTKGQQTIAIPTIIWRRLRAVGSSGTTYANIRVENGKYIRLESD